MTQPPSANQRLARQKKVQAYLSAGTATLGIAALGSKGLATAAPKASKFAALPKTGRLKPLATKIGGSGPKLDRAAQNLSIGAGGVGGIGGFNFASIQSKESKKIKKNLEHSMDFGLNTVRQGRPLEVVEKSALTPEQKARAKKNAAARGTKAGAYDNLRAAGKPMGVSKAFQPDDEVSKDWAEWNAKRKSKGDLNPKVTAHTRNVGGYNHKSGELKMYDDPHDEVSITDKGRTLVRARPKYVTSAYSTKQARRAEKDHKRGDTMPVLYSTKTKPHQMNRLAIHNAFQDKTQTHLGDMKIHRNERVKKAFDSERGRLKRLEGYSHGAAAGAGALGLAAGVTGAKAVKQTRAAKTLPAFKAGLKTGGKAGALGAGAIGGGYAANRINAFRKGSGASYR